MGGMSYPQNWGMSAMNPMAMGMQNPMMSQYMGMMGGGSVAGASGPQMQNMMSGIGAGGDFEAFDAGKMKAGRLGHYGYLEGRGELFVPMRSGDPPFVPLISTFDL